MQAMTDQQYREIARAIREACGHFDTTENNLLAEGRAAVAQAAPYLYYPLTPDERVRYRRIVTAVPFHFYSEIDVDVILEKRLAQYTVKPDPRRDAVITELIGYLVCAAPTISIEDLADRIIARLDAAGGKP